MYDFKNNKLIALQKICTDKTERYKSNTSGFRHYKNISINSWANWLLSIGEQFTTMHQIYMKITKKTYRATKSKETSQV